MKSMRREFWLTGVVLLCLSLPVFAVQPRPEKACDARGLRERKCMQVPEGGSALVYLLGAGVTCIAAMLIRSRRNQAGILASR